MIDSESLKYIIDVLCAEQKFKQAHEILDLFATKVESLVDYDTIGQLCIQSLHYDLRLECSLKTYTKSTSSEQLFAARENLYNCYNAMNLPEKALFYINQNLRIKPNDPESLVAKGFSLQLLGKLEESEKLIDSIQTNDEKISKIIEHNSFNKRIRTGKTGLGLRTFTNHNKKSNILFEKQLGLKYWDGSPQPGKTIVVAAEGGIGDEIINIRFFDTLKKLGMRPILYSSWNRFRPDTLDLFRRHGYEVISNHIFIRKEYLWTHMMNLPGFLDLKEDQLFNGPYLTPIRNPKNNIKDNKLKIGIKCTGNPYFQQDIYRCIPIEQMINAIPKEFSIYYFDKDNEYDGVISLKDKLNTWEDTLDYIDQMDVILSSCTSLVHAAGAIGKRTIVCVPITKYYTWISTKNDETTPWYGDNFTVLQQTEIRSWDKPLKRANELLCQLIGS